MSNLKIDKLLQKFSKKLSQISETKNAQNTNQNNSNNLKKANDCCNKNELQKNKQNMIQRTDQNHNAQRSATNDIDLKNKSEKLKKTQKDSIIKAMSQIINAKMRNKPNAQSTQIIDNNQTRLKSLSPNSSSQNTSRQSVNNSKLISQSSPAQANSGTSLMPKVSSMNNLIKLSLKLTPQNLLSEIKTRGNKDRISPIRYLLYFCIERILYTIWRDNGIETMALKLKNPMQERKFLLAQILKGFIELLTYYQNLQRPLISKIIMSVFNRLGLQGIFNQSWLPNCVKANLSIFQKTNAKVEQLIQAPKTKNITSNIFSNVPYYENIRSYDYIGFTLENEDSSNERIDEIDKGMTQNKLFFSQSKPNSTVQSHHSNGKTSNTQKKKAKTKTDQSSRSISSEQSQKEVGQDRAYQKELVHARKFKQSVFEISLHKIRVPDNTKVFSHQDDEEGLLENQTVKILTSQASTPKNKVDEQLHSQKRSRPQSKDLTANQYIYASRQEVQQMIQDHLFNRIDEITEKIMTKYQIEPTELKEVLKQTVLNRANPRKVLQNNNTPQYRQISRIEQKPAKNKITKLPEKPKKNMNIGHSQSHRKSEKVTLTNKQLIDLVDKTSIFFSDKGCTQQETINQIFKVLQQNNVEYEKKQEILEAWFERKESWDK